jgi:circadian clock protein KaiC
MIKTELARMETGVRNLDEILQRGWPKGSVTVIAGPPGSGKTILAQQICFHNASARSRALYFTTLSEPAAKTLRYLSQFNYFDGKKMEHDHIQFVDLGAILRTKGLEETHTAILHHFKRIKPAMVVIDSFKVFDDLAKSRDELRKFGYEIGVNLMAWETTGFLLGEYGPEEILTNPLFSIIDGLITVTHRDSQGEHQRFIQIQKMRGTEHSREEHSFVITSNGIEVYAPRLTIQRNADAGQTTVQRCKTLINRLDELLGEGIPQGSSLLIAGVAGTGKTLMLLEFVYRGALEGEKGIVISFEETPDRLLAAARGMGWHLDREIERGMVEVVFIPQPDISVEQHLLMMRDRVEALGAKRVAIDSLSVFMHKIKDPQIAREKTFQLASIVQNSKAVGFFATDIPYGSSQLSRFGVEETVVDGVILLSLKEEGLDRQRYIEIYKLRNTGHLQGRHNVVIEKGGINVFPRYLEKLPSDLFPSSVEISERISSGVSGLDELLGGGLLKRSVTLIYGSLGVGKSIMSTQFLLEGAKRGEHGIFVTLEEGPSQLLNGAKALGLPLQKAVKQGLVEIVYLSREDVRAAQFLTILTEKVDKGKAKRLVLDSTSHMMIDNDSAELGLKQLVTKLAMRFKQLGVTAIFTIETKLLFSAEPLTDYDFAPIADNVLMLRYLAGEREIVPSLTVLKTRGTEHDRGTHIVKIGKGGITIEPTKEPVQEDQKSRRTGNSKKKR